MARHTKSRRDNMADITKVVLEAKGITKQFPGVLANDHVDFDLRQGEVHALLGENGAGKTTLMNVLYGLYRPDQGEIFRDGQLIAMHTPKDAITHGIGMVHQHFMLGAETIKNGILARREVSGQIRELSRQYGLDIDPDSFVRDLPVGIQQRV